MTRFAIDARVAVRLVTDGLTVPAEHALVGPQLLRSDALALLYRAARAGELDEARRRALLDGLAELRIRLLGDRVSRAVAWTFATDLGWDDTHDAEYLAVARLQADVLVTLDPELERAAAGIVPTATFDDLVTP